MSTSTRRRAEDVYQHNLDRRSTIEQIKQCTKCSFCWNGNGPVGFSGPTPNDVMVIAESPTRTDDRQGLITHKGEASLMLRRMLMRSGLDLDHLFFTNAIACWPETGVPDRNLIACSPNLKAQLRLCDPLVVLALGATALKVTSDRRGRSIRKDHGQPFKPIAGPFMDRWVFPTWHPAALAKNASAETQLSADIAAFGEFYRGLRDGSVTY